MLLVGWINYVFGEKQLHKDLVILGILHRDVQNVGDPNSFQGWEKNAMHFIQHLNLDPRDYGRERIEILFITVDGLRTRMTAGRVDYTPRGANPAYA